MSRKGKFSIATLLIVAAVFTVMGVINLSTHQTDSASASFSVATARAVEPIGHIGNGPAADAIEKAGSQDRYAFALFYREDDDQLEHARSLFKSTRKKISRKAELVEINVTDTNDQDVVKKFGASRARLPLMLVLAPNGAIMGGFPTAQLTDDTKLVESVGCKASEQTLKALQQRNMVALCMQNKKTSDNAAAMSGVEEFLKDPKYGPTTAVVMVDPSDPVAAKFVTQLGLNPDASIATTALIAPPGTVIGTFEGATTSSKLTTSVLTAAQSRSGGCGPGGCGPGQSCGPTGGTVSTQKAPATSQQLKAQTPMQGNQVKVTQVPTTSSKAQSPDSKATPETKAKSK